MTAPARPAAASRRIACLYAADLVLQAILRAEPELASAPLAALDGPSARARVVAVTPVAKALGVRAGMTVVQATATAGELLCRVRAEPAVRSAADALADVACTFGARMERAAPDTVYLEVGDLSRLFARETSLCAAIDAAARKVGLTIRTGIAGTKAAARIAARESEDGAATLVPVGGERAFLAPRAVALADPSEELAAALLRFGLHTLGAVAALPGEGVGRRLGREGAVLWRLARGEDGAPLVLEHEVEVFAESVELDYALDSTVPLTFLFAGALSRLCARLSLRGLACAGMSLQLSLAPRGADARLVPVAAPTLDTPVLVTLLRLSLEAAAPPGPVRGFRIEAASGNAPNAQLSLFDPVLPAPAKLAATVARLSALCGAERVGAPRVIDSLRPEAQGLTPFAPGAEAAARSEGYKTPAASLRVLTLRRVSPPRAAVVRLEHELPGALDGERILRASGPWRALGEWWTESPFLRDYFDVETAHHVLCRLYREHAVAGEPTWWLDAFYD